MNDLIQKYQRMIEDIDKQIECSVWSDGQCELDVKASDIHLSFCNFLSQLFFLRQKRDLISNMIKDLQNYE